MPPERPKKNRPEGSLVATHDVRETIRQCFDSQILAASFVHHSRVTDYSGAASVPGWLRFPDATKKFGRVLDGLRSKTSLACCTCEGDSLVKSRLKCDLPCYDLPFEEMEESRFDLSHSPGRQEEFG